MRDVTRYEESLQRHTLRFAGVLRGEQLTERGYGLLRNHSAPVDTVPEDFVAIVPADLVRVEVPGARFNLKQAGY